MAEQTAREFLNSLKPQTTLTKYLSQMVGKTLTGIEIKDDFEEGASRIVFYFDEAAITVGVSNDNRIILID